jgi:hypothetical protein
MKSQQTLCKTMKIYFQSGHSKSIHNIWIRLKRSPLSRRLNLAPAEKNEVDTTKPIDSCTSAATLQFFHQVRQSEKNAMLS